MSLKARGRGRARHSGCVGGAIIFPRQKTMTSSRRIAAVYAGGAGRGVCQAGAHACLHESAALSPGWIAASSIGHRDDGLLVRNRDSRRQRARPERSAWRVRRVGASR